MKIASQTPAELVISDSTKAIGGIFAGAAGLIALMALKIGDARALFPAGIFLLFAALYQRSLVVIFDAGARSVSLRGRKMLKAEASTIAFDEIEDVITETATSDKGATMYRLAIRTRSGTVPIEVGYGGGRDLHEKIRETILAFLSPGARSGAAAEGSSAIDASVRSMLARGQKIDAIGFLRSTENLSLTEAKQRVEAIEGQKRTGD